jgi:hypothetical protein
MGFEDVIDAIAIAIQAGTPVLVEGGVGDGKTSIFESLFRRLCDERHTSIVALHEPTEYGGYPVPGPDGVALLPVAWVNRLSRNQKRAGLLLDEFTNGAPATRSATMRGVVEGVWGEKHIPRLSTAVAMNPAEIAESGYELSAPLSNRFCHIDWDMPVAYWKERLIQGFPDPSFTELPKDWRERELRTATTYLAAFANVRGAAMKDMPTEASARGKPFPSFRSFTMARDLIAACAACGYDLEHDITILLVSGCVGVGACTEFLNYSKELDLPDPEVVLRNPDRLVLPARGDRAFAILTAVTLAVLADNTVDRWNRGWAVLEVAAKQHRLDVAAAAAKALASNPAAKAPLPKAMDIFIPMLKAAGMLDKGRR